MFANAPGPPAAPPATGLVASAARPTIDRWELGLAWQPERCGVGYRLASWGCDTTPPGYVPPRLGSAYYRPVSLWNKGKQAEYAERLTYGEIC